MIIVNIIFIFSKLKYDILLSYYLRYNKEKTRGDENDDYGFYSGGTPLIKQLPIGQDIIFDSDIAAQFLRLRRSVRNYKSKVVPRDKIL